MAGLIMAFHAQRNLNNAFAYDLVPSVSVIAAALKAARRVNDFPTAVRIFEGIIPSHIYPEAMPSRFGRSFTAQMYRCHSVSVKDFMASCTKYGS